MYEFTEWKIIGSDRVSAIGLGTYGIRNYEKAFEAFTYALTHGVNLVDTAEMYDTGRAEEFVGRVVKAVGRDGVFITTKMLPNRLEDRESIVKAAEEALRRLGVSYVDLYLIHWPNERLPISVQVRNFEVLAERGLTRYIGVSNFEPAMLREAIESTGRHEIVVNQVHYSVINRHYVEKELLPFCIERKITLQAYTPLERGSVVINSAVKKMAEKYGKTPVQVALNYLISHSNVVAIPKAENMVHVKEILGSIGWWMRVEDLEYLRKYA
ncbi:aldo/keto reductase [Desulfurococcus mucosus]|nr:aldo/keto reductase [Desulfurococcus mucosus]